MTATQAPTLDDLTATTRNMVAALQELQTREEDAKRRAEEEAGHHSKTRERATALEADRAQKDRELEEERAGHAKAKKEADGHLQAHASLRQELAAVTEDFSRSQATVEVLRNQVADLEKDRDGRLAGLQAKLESSREEYEALYRSYGETKAAHEAALQAQECYRKAYHATHEELEQFRVQCGEQVARVRALESELSSAEGSKAEVVQLQDSLAACQSEAQALGKDLESARRLHGESEGRCKVAEDELHKAKGSLDDHQRQLGETRKELETYQRKAQEMQGEFGKVQDVLEKVLGKNGQSP